jgi:hypothetical protein
LDDSNGFRSDAVRRVQQQKLSFSDGSPKFDRIGSVMSGDRCRGLGLGTPKNEELSNSHGDAIAPEIPVRAVRGSRFTGVVAAINSLSKRPGEQVARHAEIFELGGHSLLLIHLARKIEELFQSDSPVREAFPAPRFPQMVNMCGDWFHRRAGHSHQTTPSWNRGGI